MLEAKVAVKDDEIDRQQRELQTLRVRNWLLRYCMYEKDSPIYILVLGGERKAAGRSGG